MAQSRIFAYDGENVSFWYHNHKTNEREDVTVTACEFIGKLVMHIHEKHFNTLRYYGLYAKKHKFADHFVLLLTRHAVNTQKLFKRWVFRTELAFGHDPTKCPCGSYMDFLGVFLPGDLAFMPP